MTIRQLGATLREPGYLESEFRVCVYSCVRVCCYYWLLPQKLPSNVVNPDDIPPGAEKKNRYSNVLPSKDWIVVGV